MKIKIGPAGLGPVKSACETLEKYKKLGFEACEIAFTYGVYIKNDGDALEIGRKAKELGISLSIHAPYYVNLNSAEKEKIEASKKRILDCCRTGELLGAKRVVFHPGYYGSKAPKSSSGKLGQTSDYGKNKEGAYEIIKKGVKEMMDEIKNEGWNIKLAPETMGKVNVFGSVEEISSLVKDTGCDACIDFAHILAREKSVDYDKVKKLFSGKEWHVHFSGIVYGEKGERHHKTTEKKEWKELFENLPKDKEIVIVNESPTMIDDCVEGLKIVKGLNL